MGSVEVPSYPMTSGSAPSLGIRLAGVHTQGIYGNRMKDRNPSIRAAGKLTATGETAEQSMQPDPHRPVSPEVVRRFRATIRPEAGKKRVFYGRANDQQLRWAADMCHGVQTQPSLMARDLVNPDPNSMFRQRFLDKKDSLYASRQRAPLGRSHDQAPGLPQEFDTSKATFGIQTKKDGTAGELVSPPKSYPQVSAEYEEGHDLYRRTHCDYRVGEQCHRNYTYPSFKSDVKFGIPTPHSNDGRHVKKTMKWLHDTESQKAAPIVSKRVDDFRERTQPQLGQVHDPIKDTLNVAPDHTFGIMIKADEYGVGDLMHCRGPGTYLRGKDRLRGIIAAMRQHLKKANYHNFEDLRAAFKHYDKNQSGKVDITELCEVCAQYNLPVDREILQQLMDYCDVDQDGQIDYMEFSNFLNWKDKMPSGLPSRMAVSAPADLRGASPGQTDPSHRLQKQIDRSIGDHRTSSSLIKAVVGGVSTRDYRKYGVPTMRTDLPAPRIRRVGDRTNYGDESDAYGLVNPSLYSTHGVYEKDFLLPRPKHQLREIFTTIGVQMDYDTFDRIYNIAASRHPGGQVSVEAFRNTMDECQANAINHTSGKVY